MSSGSARGRKNSMRVVLPQSLSSYQREISEPISCVKEDQFPHRELFMLDKAYCLAWVHTYSGLSKNRMHSIESQCLSIWQYCHVLPLYKQKETSECKKWNDIHTSSDYNVYGMIRNFTTDCTSNNKRYPATDYYKHLVVMATVQKMQMTRLIF